MKKETCENCKYFEPGECHRFPPKGIRTVMSPPAHQEPIYTTVEDKGWCGEFKEKNK